VRAGEGGGGGVERTAQGRASGAGLGGRDGTRGVRTRRGTPGSIGRLDRWVHVMNSEGLYIYIQMIFIT
jgi:hypothetical protein